MTEGSKDDKSFDMKESLKKSNDYGYMITMTENFQT